MLTVLQQHHLYAEMTKCRFETSKTEYLGHIISSKGVQADPSKISSMLQWPLPTSLKALRGFLGLTSYYRKFIKDYESIVALLTALLRNDAFQWNPKAT